MNVEKSVIISGCQKDYELQSWNEQGEITSIEGMLTVAFSVVSPCSHKDNWKELYCIIKIPYLVDMPTNEYVDVKKNVKVAEKVDVLLTPELYHQQNEKIKELSLKIEKLESEIEQLKKENLRLKIISGETESGWHKDRDWIERNDPITGEPDGYICPFDFNYNKVIYLKKFFNKEKNEKWCEFKHPYLEWKRHPFDMPLTAYLWLKGELPEQKKESERMDIYDVNNVEDMKRYIVSHGWIVPNSIYFEKMAKFILAKRGKSNTFYAGELDQACGFKDNRTTRRDFCKRFIEWGFIEELKKKGQYRVIF